MLTTTKHTNLAEKNTYGFIPQRNENIDHINQHAMRVFDSNTVQFNNSNVVIQPKLKINTAGDKYEIEADRIAEQVVNMSNADSIKQYGDSKIQRK